VSPIPTGLPVFQVRIRLAEVEPLVWRRLLVPGGARLDKLHRIFQAAMGWRDYHLHSFEIGGSLLGTQIDDAPEEELDEKSVTLQRAVSQTGSFSYEYDFGDSFASTATARVRLRTAVVRAVTRICSTSWPIRRTTSTSTCSAGPADSSIPRNSTWPS
jgi:hypothetical protein